MDGWLVRCDLDAGSFEAAVGDDARLVGAQAVEAGDAGAPPSVARWSPERGELTLERDPTGQVPLFHARAGRTLVASTDLRALLAEPGVPTGPDPLHVAEWLLGSSPDPEATLLRGVRRVPPGHARAVSRGEARLRRTWTPPDPGTAARDGDAAGAFGAALETAVARAHAGRVTGVFLSGGVDSASVAAAAAAVTTGLPRSPLALCLAFAGASEEATQRTVADALGLERITVAARTGAALLDRALERAAGAVWPAGALWGPFYDDLATQALGRGVEVVLDGLGGDELLDAGIAAGRALRRRPRAFARWLRAEARYVSTARASARAAWSRPRPPALPAWLAPDPVLHAALAERAGSPPDGYAAVRAHDLVDPLLAVSRETARDDGARLGLRRRSPLWDVEVVSVLNALDPAELVAAGLPKAPARGYLATRIPGLGGAWPRPQVADALYGELVAEMEQRVRGPLPGLETLGVVPRARDAVPFPPGLLWTILLTEQWALHAIGES